MERVPERLVEVWAGDDRHGGHLASGWVVGVRGVLTVWHVVEPYDGPGRALLARMGRSQTDGWCDCELRWHAPELDVALLEIVDGRWRVPVRAGALARIGDQPLSCNVVGFPDAERQQEAARNTEQAQGVLLPAGGARGGGVRFDIDTSTPEDSAAWSGMSGAPVRDSEGRLVAIITEAHPERQQRRLHAAAVLDIVTEPGFREAARKLGQDSSLEDASMAVGWPGRTRKQLGPIGRSIGELTGPFALEVLRWINKDRQDSRIPEPEAPEDRHKAMQSREDVKPAAQTDRHAERDLRGQQEPQIATPPAPSPPKRKRFTRGGSSGEWEVAQRGSFYSLDVLHRSYVRTFSDPGYFAPNLTGRVDLSLGQPRLPEMVTAGYYVRQTGTSRCSVFPLTKRGWMEAWNLFWLLEEEAQRP
ncbi:serine protease [Streptomyces sp. NPDC005820]|uniref:S1 family peptidase n=1 Tax=Streptomyces sp. NPDC005820 TaxID=3157069 RepID=UPI0033D7494B